MYTFVLVVQILLAISITILVLLQRSEGGLGGMSGQSVNSFLTARQAGNALSRLTKWFFVCFCLITILLIVMTKKADQHTQFSLMPDVPVASQEE